MKVLVVSECYPTKDKPQYGVFIKQQSDAFKALGHQVDVVVPFRSPTDTELGKEISQSGEIFKIGYKTIRYDLFPLLVAKKTYKNLFSFISENKYDLVSVHITSDVILKIVVKICRKNGIPVAVHYHGLNVWKDYETTRPLRQKIAAIKRRNILKKVSVAVGVSQKVTEIIRKKLKSVPCYTVYNGVNTELFINVEKVKSGTFTIVGVGNLIKIKGFNYLIKAFGLLRAEHSDVSLKIIGEGVELESLQAEAIELGVQDAVTFMGKIPYDDVAKEMAAADAFALPSFYEALGCVYLEAMACKLPTVGVKGMGIDEIIEDGINGYLVEPKDYMDLYKVLNDIYLNREKADDIAEQGKKTAVEFTWAKSAEKLDEVYKTVVKG